MLEVQEEGANDPVRSVQGDGWFERTIPLPVPERVQPARLALPHARQELLTGQGSERGKRCEEFNKRSMKQLDDAASRLPSARRRETSGQSRRCERKLIEIP